MASKHANRSTIARMTTFRGVFALCALGTAGLLTLARTPAAAQQPARDLPSWSGWRQLSLERPETRSFIQDDRLEFRWKQDWTDRGYTCTVEVRPIDDIPGNITIPEIDIWYRSPNSIYAAPGVAVGPRAPQDHNMSTSPVRIGSDRLGATFDAPDCARVIAVAAGHFAPDVAIPAF